MSSKQARKILTAVWVVCAATFAAMWLADAPREAFAMPLMVAIFYSIEPCIRLDINSWGDRR